MSRTCQEHSFTMMFLRKWLVTGNGRWQRGTVTYLFVKPFTRKEFLPARSELHIHVEISSVSMFQIKLWWWCSVSVIFQYCTFCTNISWCLLVCSCFPVPSVFQSMNLALQIVCGGFFYIWSYCKTILWISVDFWKFWTSDPLYSLYSIGFIFPP